MCAGAAFFVLTGAAMAQEAGEIETVTVTARKMAENLQDVPGSLTVLTAEDLRSTGTDTTSDLFNRVPNVSASGGIGGVLQGQFGIRGISTLIRNIGVESGLGIYVDGVYQGRPDNYNQELIDVAQVEVLRGPQGTIFGKNTIAGALNVTTVKPQDDRIDAAASAEFGNYGLKRFAGYVTAPLVDDTLSGKLSLGYVTRGGFTRHLSVGPDADSLDLFSYRSSLYYTPASNSSFVLTIDGLHDRGRPSFFQATDIAFFQSPEETTPHTVDNNRPDYLRRDNYGVSLTGTVDLPFGTVTSITAYRMAAYRASLDDDQNQIDYMAIDQWGDRTVFWSQEFRLNGEIGSDVKYVAGLFYLGQSASTDRLFALGAGLGVPGGPLLTTRGHVGTRDFAAYGNVDYDITDALTASFGLRYTYEDKDVRFFQDDVTGFYTFIGFPDVTYDRNVSDGDVSPTFSLSYRFSPDAMGYVRIARGYKSAAFNVDLVSTNVGLSADPESATTYEAGLKTSWFDNRVRANASIFETKYNDMQVQQVQGVTIALDNAGAATIDGAELEIEALVLPELRLDLGIGALDPRYDSYPDCAPFGVDCSGNQIIAAPAWTGILGLEYTHPLGDAALIARVDYNFQSPVYFDAMNSKAYESDARGLVNVRAGVDFGKYAVTMWAQNLTDDTYITYADNRSAIGVLRTTAYGAPRTFGATLTARL
jgi:iron complex outermembrane receptor protein